MRECGPMKSKGRGPFFSHRRRSWLARAFSLVEVLVAMALAALVLGVLLRSVGLELAGVARVMPRYQNLILASYELEAALGERTPGDEKRDFYPYPRQPGDGDPWKIEITSETTTADPRLEQVALKLIPTIGPEIIVSAYRLRNRHADQAPPGPSPSPGASPGPPSGSPSPGGPGNQGAANTGLSGATPSAPGGFNNGGGTGFNSGGNTTGGTTGGGL